MENKSATVEHRPEQGEANITVVFKLKLARVYLSNFFISLEYFYLVNLLTMKG